MGSFRHTDIMGINGRWPKSCLSQWFGPTDTYLVRVNKNRDAGKDRTLYVLIMHRKDDFNKAIPSF